MSYMKPYVSKMDLRVEHCMCNGGGGGSGGNRIDLPALGGVGLAN